MADYASASNNSVAENGRVALTRAVNRLRGSVL
jgi:hypothetical protein